MARLKKVSIKAIWRQHGDRILVSVLFILLVAGVVFGVQGKATDSDKWLDYFSKKKGDNPAVGGHGGFVDPKKVLEVMQKQAAEKEYENIPSKNIFLTPEKHAEIVKRIESDYRKALVFFNDEEYRRALELFNNIAHDDPMQILISYKDGMPKDKAKASKRSLDIQDIQEASTRAESEWQEAQKQKSDKPIAAANGFLRAVGIYQKILQYDQEILSPEVLDLANRRVKEGQKTAGSLLQSNLTADVRRKLNALQPLLSIQRYKMEELEQLHAVMLEIEKSLIDYPDNIREDTKKEAQEKIVKSREAIDKAAPALFAQAQTNMNEALKSSDLDKLRASNDSLQRIKVISPKFTEVDPILKRSQTELLKMEQGKLEGVVKAEINRLNSGLKQMRSLESVKNWSQFINVKNDLTKNKDTYLKKAKGLKNRQLPRNLSNLYKRVAEYNIPKEIEFIEIDQFQKRGGRYKVKLRNKNDSSTSGLLGVNQRFSTGGTRIVVLEVKFDNKTVRIGAKGFRDTTIQQK
jgi:hypothetical protein